MVHVGERRHAQDQQADERGDRPVDPLDPDLEAGVEARQELALEAARPVRAGKPRVRGAHDHADDDEQERGGDGRGGEPLEAGHWSSGLGARGILDRLGADAVTLPTPLRHVFRAPSTAVRRAGHRRRRLFRRGSTGTAMLPDRFRHGAGAAAIPRRPTRPPAGWGIAGGRRHRSCPILITSPVVCGPNRVLFSFVDTDNRPIAAPDRSASLAIYELGRNAETAIATVQGEFIWAIEDVAASTSRT